MATQFNKDELYASPMAELIDFSFDEKTVAVFPDMINRSVPGYSLMQSLTGLVASERVTKNTNVYDLGCSLGASSLTVINSVDHSDYDLILVDQSQSMIEYCQQIFSCHNESKKFYFHQQDIREIEIKNSSLVMLNLVLQFLPKQDRQTMVDKIHSGLVENGALLLSEKVEMESAREKLKIDELYISFKKRSGYSDLEISQKRQALENVMQIESIDVHMNRLKDAGFSIVMPVMQALNFVTLLAVK